MEAAIALTPAQLTLNDRVLAVLVDVSFERIPGSPYQFEFDAQRQLLLGRHFTGGQWWTTRKWFISEHATDSEITQTVLKLCLTSAEHEAREAFLFRGRAIYGPHLEREALWLMAVNTDHRKDSTQ